MTMGIAITTCSLCNGPRTGRAWRRRDGKYLPVCVNCDGAKPIRPRGGGAWKRCTRLCGPDGKFGPRCIRYEHPNPADCRPSSQGGVLNRILRAQAARRKGAAA